MGNGSVPTIGLRLGSRVGPFDGTVDRDDVQRFAVATSDPSPRVQAGEVVPPVAMVTRLWDAQNESRAELIPMEFQLAAAGGVHGEHDLVVQRPVVPGEPLRTWVEGFGARTVGRNSVITLRYRTFDAHDSLVVEQLWTTVWLGVTCEDVGGVAPDHSFPAEARERPLGTWSAEVDEDMARRYAEVSGDWSPHHFDAESARRSGSESVFLHGICTMALCAQGVAALAAAGDPERIARLCVRFARPVLLGDRLDVRLFEAGPLGYAFEAESNGKTVISQGRAELR